MKAKFLSLFPHATPGEMSRREHNAHEQAGNKHFGMIRMCQNEHFTPSVALKQTLSSALPLNAQTNCATNFYGPASVQ
jgi:hypothetical protein